MGSKALDLLADSGISKVTKAISIFGLTLIGAMAAQRVVPKIAVSFMSDGQPVMLQDILNNLFPNILGLALIIGLYFLMKTKKVNTTALIYGMMVVVIILSIIGIV